MAQNHDTWDRRELDKIHFSCKPDMLCRGGAEAVPRYS